MSLGLNELNGYFANYMYLCIANVIPCYFVADDDIAYSGGGPVHCRSRIFAYSGHETSPAFSVEIKILWSRQVAIGHPGSACRHRQPVSPQICEFASLAFVGNRTDFSNVMIILLKMHLKMLSVKCGPFCPGLIVLQLHLPVISLVQNQIW